MTTSRSPDVRLIAEGRAAAASGHGRLVRRRARLSQTDIARALGVGVDAIGRWELGNATPAALHAAAYALLLRRLEAITPGPDHDRTPPGVEDPGC